MKLNSRKEVLVLQIVVLNGTYEKKYIAFLNQLKELYSDRGYIVNLIDLEDQDINYCTGCFSCWVKITTHSVVKPLRCLFEFGEWITVEHFFNRRSNEHDNCENSQHRAERNEHT